MEGMQTTTVIWSREASIHAIYYYSTGVVATEEQPADRPYLQLLQKLFQIEKRRSSINACKTEREKCNN